MTTGEAANRENRTGLGSSDSAPRRLITASWLPCVLGLLLTSGCAPVTEAERECRETSISLTGGSDHIWGEGNQKFDGHASIVVCDHDADAFDEPMLRALFQELSDVVDEKGFLITDICPPSGKESFLPGERAELLSRLDSRAGTDKIRGVDCAFGWGFFIDGEPMSGLEARGSWVVEGFWRDAAPELGDEFFLSFFTYDYVVKIDELIDRVGSLPARHRQPYDLPEPLPRARTLNDIAMIYTMTDFDGKRLHNLSMSQETLLHEDAARILFALFARRAGLALPSRIYRSQNGVFHADWEVEDAALSRQLARSQAARHHSPGMAFTEAFVAGMYSVSIEPIVIRTNPGG